MDLDYYFAVRMHEQRVNLHPLNPNAGNEPAVKPTTGRARRLRAAVLTTRLHHLL